MACTAGMQLTHAQVLILVELGRHNATVALLATVPASQQQFEGFRTGLEDI